MGNFKLFIGVLIGIGFGLIISSGLETKTVSNYVENIISPDTVERVRTFSVAGQFNDAVRFTVDVQIELDDDTFNSDEYYRKIRNITMNIYKGGVNTMSNQSEDYKKLTIEYVTSEFNDTNIKLKQISFKKQKI